VQIETKATVITPPLKVYILTLIVTRQCNDHSFSMMATTSLESSNIAIQAKVKFADISQLSEGSVHILKAYIGGGWRLKTCIPKAAPDGESSLALYFGPSFIGKMIGIVGAIKISFSLESLRGEVHTTKAFEWDLPGDNH
jgi:hypothetical protein